MNKEHRNLRAIEFQGKYITLLGTAHVSKSSVEDVEGQLSRNHFDAVAVELCPNRHKALQNPDSLAKMDLFQVLRENKTTMVLANLALGAYQQRIADEIGIDPGAEMKAAVRIGQEMKIPVLLIDREIGTTLKRVAGNIPWWQHLGLLAGLLASIVTHDKVTEEEIEKLKQGDILESALTQFAERNDRLFKPLIEERDEYMALRLQSELDSSPFRNVLAVVGAGHLSGIAERFAAPLPGREAIEARLAQLDQIKKRGPWMKIISWLIVVLIFAGFALGFHRSANLGFELVIEWIVLTGGLSALGTLFAAAHPLTVLAAFLAAPLTTLNPTIGAGFVTAAAELYLRKPEVGDFSRLRSDTARLKGWWKNRVARTLLIFLFSSLGAAAGVYIAGFRIVEKLTLG
ncbi:MAG: TraB/GumN family protein [Methylococcaceae bacterium]|nr:TraB/GumN family protein [Methylococcaceae bacterium]